MRLIHDALGTTFDADIGDLELGFWNAGVETRPMPGVIEALAYFRSAGILMGVVSNSSFRQHVIRHELSKHGIAEFVNIVVVSAEFVVRKPNPLIIEAAAGLLGTSCADTWVCGRSHRHRRCRSYSRRHDRDSALEQVQCRGETTALTVTHWSEIAKLVGDAG